MRRTLLVLIACCGCRQAFGLESPLLDTDAASQGDDSDALDSATPDVCLGTGNFLVCVPSTLQPRSFTADLSLDTGTTCDVVDSAHPEWCILAGSDLTIGAKIRATGTRPLVIVATHDLTIQAAGGVDVDSRGSMGANPGGIGAGANSDECASGATGTTATAGSPSTLGGGGGAGGGFGTAGGNGGKGDSNLVNGGVAAMVMDTNTAPDKLRGGCAGTAGGAGASTSAGGGAGGGAVYIVAGHTLSIAGTVNASGQGGHGGVASKGGGGGGGSGGMIALWGPTLMLTGQGQLFANGGGGGGGADNGVSGSPGGISSDYATAAVGGFGGGVSSCGGGPGCGGGGARNSQAGGPGGNDGTGAGGGGGGGGGGVIYLVSGGQLSGNVSPPAR